MRLRTFSTRRGGLVSKWHPVRRRKGKEGDHQLELPSQSRSIGDGGGHPRAVLGPLASGVARPAGGSLGAGWPSRWHVLLHHLPMDK